MQRRTFIMAAGALCAAPAGRAVAKAWTDDTVRFVVPFAPGGGMDIVGRLVAERLAQRLGGAFIVDNRAGAGTIVGTQAVATAAPDGKMFLVTTNNLTINPSLYRKLPYDTASLVPVVLIAEHPLVLLANPGKGINSLEELVAKAKAQPGKLTYASVGNGSPQHLEMEIFMRATGIEMVHVSYQGSAPAVTDLIGGNVDVMFNGISPTLAHIRSGKLRALAVDSRARVSVLPEVPSVTEFGVPEFRTISWSALFAPRNTPPEIVRALAAEVSEVLKEPETRARLEKLGLQPSGLQQEPLAARLAAEQKAWAEVIQRVGVKAD